MMKGSTSVRRRPARPPNRPNAGRRMPLLRFQPFAVADLAAVSDLPADALDPRAADQMTGHGLAWTGSIDGRIVGCGGILPQHAGRGLCWLAVLPDLPRRAWIEIRAKAAAVLAHAHRLGLRRIEADVRTTFAAGRRFALALGFEIEANRPLYDADGGASLLMARFG